MVEPSGIKLNITEGFAQKLAKRVKEKNEGARGIKTIFSTFKDEIDKNIQLGDIEEVIIPEESIDDVKKMIYIKKNNKLYIVFGIFFVSLHHQLKE